MQPETLSLLQGHKEIAVDYETTSKNNLDCRILGLALANGSGVSTFIRSKQEIAEVVQYMNENYILALIYNAPYDLGVSKSHGISLWKLFHDVFVGAKLYDERHNGYKLNQVGGRLVDPFFLDYKDQFKEYLKEKYGKEASFESCSDEEDFAKLSEYAKTDALLTLLIWKKIKPILIRDNLWNLQCLEDEVIRVLVDVHHDGIRVDREYLQKADKTLARLLLKLEAMAKEYTKDYTEEVKHSNGKRGKAREAWTTVEHVDVNIASGPQLGKVFQTLGVSSPLRTPKGSPSWSTEALAVIDHPLANLVSEYRVLKKLHTGFVVPWLEKTEKEARLHPQVHTVQAVTGRMSMSEPNLQQVPKNGTSTDEEDLIWVTQGFKDSPELYNTKKIDAAVTAISKSDEKQINVRKALTADNENFTLIKMDYVQMEVVLFAYYSKDPTMVEALSAGRDIHSEMAKQLFSEAAKLPEDSPEFKVYRKNAKSVVFGLIYGIGARTLSIQLGITEEDAKELIKLWYKRFPRTKIFIDECKNAIYERGYVTTILGRRRRLSSKESYKAVNAVIQGTAADIVKKAVVEIHKQLWPEVQIKFLVHDEVVAQVPNDYQKINELAKKMQDIMCSQADIVPPLSVDYDVGFAYAKEEKELVA